MSSANKRTKGVWLAGLAAMPMICAAGAQAQQSTAQSEKLEWLLTTHNVRYAIQTPMQTRGTQDCLGHEAEQSR
jgi:hypothetical protein